MRPIPIFLATILLVLCFSVSAGVSIPEPQGDDDDDARYDMTVLVSPSCDGNVVTVTGKGEAVPDAHVSVKDVTNANLVASGDTGADGKFVFEGCGMKVDVKVTSVDYTAVTATQQLVDCGQCGAGEPQCTENSGCPAASACSGGECVQVQCECGKVENHQCMKYACCSDSDCSRGQECVDHACVSKPPEEQGGCRSNPDCKDSEFCMLPASNNAGTCKPVTDEGCGEVRNHAFVAYGYECGAEAGCPSCKEGYDCIEHKCVQSDVTCPAEGVVGANQACGATENGQPCANCDYVVTDPAGKNSTGTTDQNGSFTLPLGQEGTYKVALLKDGKIVKIIEVKSLPKAQGGEEGKPAGSGSDMTPIIGGVLLLLLIAAAIFFWKSQSGKK